MKKLLFLSVIFVSFSNYAQITPNATKCALISVKLVDNLKICTTERLSYLDAISKFENSPTPENDQLVVETLTKFTDCEDSVVELCIESLDNYDELMNSK